MLRNSLVMKISILHGDGGKANYNTIMSKLILILRIALIY